MVPYKRMYFYLFNRITDALRALDQGDEEKARAVLLLAQQDMEARYIAEGGEKTEGRQEGLRKNR